MFNGFVSNEHKLLIKKFLKENKQLEEIFGNEWIRNNLLVIPLKKTSEVHPLFYYFSNPTENNLLAKGLVNLWLEGRKKIIHILKRDKEGVGSLVRQIQAYESLRANLENKIIWEPTISSQDKNRMPAPDLLCINNSKNVYIEVFSMFKNEAERLSNIVMNELHQRINSCRENKYQIFINIKNPLKPEYIEKIWNFIKKEMMKVKKESLPLKRTFFINSLGDSKKEIPIVEIEFNKTGMEFGFFGGYSMGTLNLNWNKERIKYRLKEKLDGLQFPNNNDINGYLIYLDSFLMDANDVIYAIKGARTVTFFSSSHESIVGYADDGLISDSKYGELLLNNVDFIIGTNNPNTISDEKITRIIINNERSRISEVEIKKIFNINIEFPNSKEQVK